MVSSLNVGMFQSVCLSFSEMCVLLFAKSDAVKSTTRSLAVVSYLMTTQCFSFKVNITAKTSPVAHQIKLHTPSKLMSLRIITQFDMHTLLSFYGFAALFQKNFESIFESFF